MPAILNHAVIDAEIPESQPPSVWYKLWAIARLLASQLSPSAAERGQAQPAEEQVASALQLLEKRIRTGSSGGRGLIHQCGHAQERPLYRWNGFGLRRECCAFRKISLGNSIPGKHQRMAFILGKTIQIGANGCQCALSALVQPRVFQVGRHGFGRAGAVSPRYILGREPSFEVHEVQLP
jgi:hypothetical protein